MTTEKEIRKLQAKVKQLEAQKLNSIELSGVSVVSTNSTLQEVESCINRLLEKHTDYLLLKRENRIKFGGRVE